MDLAALLVRHAARLRTAALLVSLALMAALTLAACSGGPFSKPTGHACSDKVAQSVATFKSVPGLWSCLSPTFQNSLHAYGGVQGDSVFVPTDGSTSAAVAYTYAGSHGDLDLYVVTLKPDSKGHVQTLGVLIWTDSSGKVSNVGVGTPAF